VDGPVATPQNHNALAGIVAGLGDLPDVVSYGDRPAADSPLSVISAAADADPAFAALVESSGFASDLTAGPGADVAGIYAAAAGVLPDQMAAVYDGSPQSGGVVVRITTQAGNGAIALQESLDAAFSPLAAIEGIDVQVTSEGILEKRVGESLSDSQVASLLVTLAAAALLLTVVYWLRSGRPGLGLITIAPVVLVVLWSYGIMAAADIPFTPSTAMVAALAIGIGVAYTIHIVHRFLEDRERHDTIPEAVRSTLRHTGGALTGSGLTTLAGFGVLLTSTLEPFRQLGAVVVFSIGFAMVAAIAVLPSMLVLWDRYDARKARRGRV
jgi:multidrug efflux pump subunit AcrB